MPRSTSFRGDSLKLGRAFIHPDYESSTPYAIFLCAMNFAQSRKNGHVCYERTITQDETGVRRNAAHKAATGVFCVPEESIVQYLTKELPLV